MSTKTELIFSLQGEEALKPTSTLSSHRVNKDDSAKSSSTSVTKNGNPKSKASAEPEAPASCGGGGLSDADKELGDTLPFFVEAERLASLRSLRMIERTPESRFDSITSIMKAVFQVPICAITLIEDDTIHFHSRAGPWAKTAPRHGSFCDRILEGAAPRMLVVEDAQADTRFCKNRYVTGKPYIRFYAGSPLVGSRGHRYGTLCVIDSKPRRFTAEQYLMLCHFAELATRELERDKIMNADQSELKNALRGAKSATGQVLRAMDALNEAVMLTDVSQPDWPVVYCNDAWSKATGSDPEVIRASSTSSSITGSGFNTSSDTSADDLTGPPLQPLAPFWHMFKGKAVDPAAVATAMAAARLGNAFTLSVRSTVRRGEVINLRFKPVSEPGRLGAAAMPQVAVPAGIGLDWMLQDNVDGHGGCAPAAAPRLGRAVEPISPDLTHSKRAELAAALSVLSGNPLAEPQNNSIEKTAAAATAAAATVEQQDSENHTNHLLPEPVYYLGVVLNQGPPQPPPRRFPISPFHNYGDTTTEIVVPGIVTANGNHHQGGNKVNGGAERYDTDGYHGALLSGSTNTTSGPFGSDDSYLSSPHGSNYSEPSQKELQAAAQLACSATVWDSVASENGPGVVDEKYPKSSADQTTPLQALLGTARTSTGVQSTSSAWGLIDIPPPYLRGDVTLGALVGCGKYSRCYRGVWKEERVAVKVTDMWRESYDSSSTIFTLPLAELPSHENLVPVLASAVVTSPTGIPNRTHLEVWTVEGFCNRGQLGDAIESGQIHGAAYNPLTACISTATNGNSSGGSSPRANGAYDLRAILLTAHDIASAMAALHSSGTIHGALTSNNVLLTSDSGEKYRGWKAVVGDYALVASEAAISGNNTISNSSSNSSTPRTRLSAESKKLHGGYTTLSRNPAANPAMAGAAATASIVGDGNGDNESSGSEPQNHPLFKFRGTTVRAMNRPPCAAHIPPDVLLGAPLTPSSDVYSFGVLLWEMLCARRAWRALRPMEVVHAVAVQGCRLPTEIKGVPVPVADVMRQCLEDDATARPSFKQVAEALNQLRNTMA
jgi:serine/threonine protein kinase